MIGQQIREPEFDRFAASYRDMHNASIALTGETGEYFAEYKSKFMAAELATNTSQTILDFGCGIGLLSGQLKRQMPASRIDGFDVSAASLREVAPELRGQGVFTTDLRELAPEYDAVVVANVLHHVGPKDRQQTVATAAARLKPGGKLVIFEHNPANPLTRRAVNQCAFDRDAILARPSEIRGYVAQCGLSGIAVRYIVFFPRFLRALRFLEPGLSWCPAGAQYVIVGTRKSGARLAAA